MSEDLYLFTLHESEEEFRVEGAVLARSPQEAASILGGEYVEVENQPPGSSTGIDDLNLFGKIRFAPELFRYLSDKELARIGLDWRPHVRHYEKHPGLVVWEQEASRGSVLVLRRNFVCLPEYARV